MMRNRCRICKHYVFNPDKKTFYNEDHNECEYCKFEYNEDLPYDDDNWDIFSLDDDFEWSHLQLLDRLNRKGVPCIATDLWFDNNLAILIGCAAFPHKIASALNISEDVIYVVGDTTMVVLNLYMEKCLRKQKK